MRIVLGFLIILAASPAMPLEAETQKRTCLDSQRVRNWIVVDDETLLIDSGRKKYRLHLQESCPRMGTSATLQFRGDPINGRVCGSLDFIRVEGEQCRISKIEEIDKQTFNNEQNRKKLILKATKGEAKAEKTTEN